MYHWTGALEPPARHKRIKTMTYPVYRISQLAGHVLPTSWAYCDAELEPEAERGVGAQVWLNADAVAHAVLGAHDVDGEYTSDRGYDKIHVIHTTNVRDSVGPWGAVIQSEVESVGVVPASALVEWLEAKADELDEDVEDVEWDEFEEEIEAFLVTSAQDVTDQVEYRDTLPSYAP